MSVPLFNDKQGFIYILINPSMEGLVKVGRTSRDPVDRAKELSAATGVPTPFTLVYKAYFPDCSMAETFIHTRLAERNYRVSPDREFFFAPVYEIIDVVLEAKALFGNEKSTNRKSDVSEAPDQYSDLWRNVYGEAKLYFFGVGNYLRDYSEAINLFEKAGKLGSPQAYLWLGNIYRKGIVCPANYQRAVECLKLGISRGEGRCWAELALYYGSLPIRDYVNASKSWKNYFSSESFAKNLEFGETFFSKLGYCVEYLMEVASTKIELQYKEFLLPLKQTIYDFIDRTISRSDKKRDEILIRRLERSRHLLD